MLGSVAVASRLGQEIKLRNRSQRAGHRIRNPSISSSSGDVVVVSHGLQQSRVGVV